MDNKKSSVLLPSIACSLILGAATVFFIFNDRFLPVFMPICLAVAIIGLVVSARKTNVEDTIRKDRWKVSVIALLSNMLLYVVAAWISGSREESGLLSAALIVMFFFILPFYFGAASLLAIVLIRSGTKNVSSA
jgi:hypothetical protein